MIRPEGRRLPPGIAVLPSVTGVSRASLLSGRLTTGKQADEKTAFRDHPGLRALTGAAQLPVLFHKAELAGESEPVSESVLTVVADPKHRVVGVVVNAIDDHLGRGDQVRALWDVDTIAPLAMLLQAAAQAGRVVVLASDHGHVLEAGGLHQPATGAGERWRPAEGEPGDGEILLAGPRVLEGRGRIIAPWTEGIRYKPRKHGYHGGATPQEVVVPLVVLSSDEPPIGWAHVEEVRPVWWDGFTRSTDTLPSGATDDLALERLFDPDAD
jgi:hypothetical protein